MKKLLSIIFATAFTMGALVSADNAYAQTEPGDIVVGGGLAFGTGVGLGDVNNDIGIRADAYYSINENIRAGGDFTFYFPKSEGNVTATVWELNINGNYIFHEEDELMVYALGGINITGFNIDYDGQFDSSSDTEAGLNIGAGVEYGLDFADLFGEAKIGNLGGDANQFVLGVGLRFQL